MTLLLSQIIPVDKKFIVLAESTDRCEVNSIRAVYNGNYFSNIVSEENA
jgi:hypothetical protein